MANTLAPQRLRILTFPQRITDDQLELRILVLPTQRLLNDLASFESQLEPGTTVDLPQFISADLQLEVRTIKGLSSYPFSSSTALGAEGASVDPFPTTIAFPANLPLLYEGLKSQFEVTTKVEKTTIGAGPTLPDNDGIRKHLPNSYRNAFNFTNPRTQFAKTDDSYQCAIKRSPGFDPSFKQSGNEITWGRVIAFCLRQPLLAESVGLLYRETVTLPDNDYCENGGWVYCHLLAPNEFGITNADELREYAARIPPIDQDRQLFAAVLFPVVEGPAPPVGDFDTLKIEAADYDDGFSKIVHATQPVSGNLLSEEPDGIHVQKDVGIRLGWDDEQLLIWQNRQVLADPNTPGKRSDAPLGVFSYRVDVKEKNGPKWNSLVLIRSKEDLILAGELIAPAATKLETGVQVYPTKINPGLTTNFWLPSYFTQWYGPSLVLPDARAAELDASGALANPGDYQDAKIPAHPDQKGGLYEPLLPDDCELKYGKEYEFRVRLADLTGGGPLVTDDSLNDAPASSSSRIFQRFVAPKQVKLTPLDPQTNPGSRTFQFFEGNSFEVHRPRLGYPSLLFTEMDTNDAFQKLIADKEFLHTNKVGDETIKEQREVSYFDPDVDRLMVIVEVKTILLDTMASPNQRETFIPLYTTFRSFPVDPEQPIALELEYRDANVIDFGNELSLGDLNLSQAEIDNGDAIVLPTSRDIRITLLPACSDKPANPEYFGFAKTSFVNEFFTHVARTGEPIQFFVRQDAADELGFFKRDLESNQFQGIYLQPDSPQIVNATTLIAEVVAGKEMDQSLVMQRLAMQLGLDPKGLSLIGKPGERIQFGCSNRIRHTLAPDNSAITFATSGELINHWLCVLSFEIDRDWTWDGLNEEGIEFTRKKRFTNEPDTEETEVVGRVSLQKTASRLAITKPDRSYTRFVFIDAVEPKKDQEKPTTVAAPFPNTIDVEYSLKPHFISSVNAAASDREQAMRSMQLPVTTIPAQVLKVVAAGYALSPYQPSDDYSQTALRERYLWLEFEEPVQDPNDTVFARILTYAPDPLLSYANPDQLLVKQEDPPLPIPPEPIRVITRGHGNDNAGLDAMQMMRAETAEVPMAKISPVHWLLPLPPGLHNDSGELFGFFAYELRVGHTDRIWCTAQGRFGHPTRLTGVQHPAPPLKCLVDRKPSGITVSSQYATALFSGKNVTSKPPKTEIWCMLYAQVKQADAKQNRNILLSEVKLQYVESNNLNLTEFLARRSELAIKDSNSVAVALDIPATGIGGWSETEIIHLLDQFNLDGDTSLSVLAVEMMPRYDQYILFGPEKDEFVRPLSRQLGQYRILRTSPLMAAPEICCETCGP